jgi:hypothetical protein
VFSYIVEWVVISWPAFLPAGRLVLGLSNDLNDFIIRLPPLPPPPKLCSRFFFFGGAFQSRNGYQRP